MKAIEIIFNFFNSLKVVNDVAERNIALISQYNQRLTKVEDQFQGLLQTVKKLRQSYPNCKKKKINVDFTAKLLQHIF